MNLTECVNHYFEILLMKFNLAERKKMAEGRKAFDSKVIEPVRKF